MTISIIERNLAFTTIRDTGLDPRTCKLAKNNVRNLYIKHPSTGSYFDIYQRRWINKDQIWVRQYVPTLLTSSKVALAHEFYYNWDDVATVLANWTRLVLERQKQIDQSNEHLRMLAEIPDLWSSSPDLAIPGDEGGSNTPFTAEEQATITRQIHNVKKSARETFKLSTPQISNIEKKLTDLEEASHRTGRKDWTLLFAGTIFTLLVTDLVPPDVVQHIFLAVIHGLPHLFPPNTGHGMIET